MFRSLKSKIAVTMFVMVLISTITGMVLTGSLLMRSHRDSVHRQLEATGAGLIAMGISDFSELADFAQLNAFIESALQMEKVDKIVRIYDSSKKMIFTTVGVDYDLLPTELSGNITKPFFMTQDGTMEKYESLVLPYKGRWDKQFYLQVLIPLPRYTEILGLLWQRGLIVLAVLVVITLFVANKLSARLVMPIGAIANHLQNLDPARIEEWKSLEQVKEGQYLGPITSGINLLTARTQAAVQNLRRMTRYVSHELRTPLTILQGEAETVLSKNTATLGDYQAVLKSSLEEVQRMAEIVATVSRVAEDERIMRNFQPQKINIVHWVNENKPHWEKTLGRRIRFDSMIHGPSHAYIDPKLLSRLIDNLVRNIKIHTPPKTSCTIKLTQSQKGARLVVTDNGPGLGSPLLESLRQPSAMIASDGIGLNLCRRIAEICKLNLNFTNRPKGGLEVEIDF